MGYDPGVKFPCECQHGLTLTIGVISPKQLSMFTLKLAPLEKINWEVLNPIPDSY